MPNPYATTTAATAALAAAGRYGADGERRDRLQALIKCVRVHLEVPDEKRDGLGSPQRKHHGVIFEGIFDRLVGNFHNCVHHVGQADIV